MATRGVKPKPAALRVVDGTHRTTRHGAQDEAERAADEARGDFGDLVRPKHLTGEARKAWDAWIAPARWLDGSKAAAAIAFCELWKSFRADPAGFAASHHGQMRAYMAELGLTDERNRTRATDDKPKDPSEQYF
ncbi:MAG: hypothetical protein AAGG09_14285 [Pseudomonadota bacterium]